jgi:hypothetical protein
MVRRLDEHDSRVNGRRATVGEDTSYVTRDVARKNGLPDHDYWLFDSRELVTMHFDDDDKFVGGEVVEDAAEIVKYNYWRDAAQHCAVKREDFVRQQG